MLYSPINYQGNKSRISEKIISLIPSNIENIHEIFCGSAIISLASNIKNVYLNDKNTYILELLRYFQENKAENIIKIADSIINEYGLTNTFYEGKEKYPEKRHEGLSLYNKDSFNKLKEDYNKDKDINKLFVLLIYGFNHYLRFNSKDEYNVPVGKTDFVDSLRKRTVDYCLAIQKKSIEITNLDFRDSSLYKDKGLNDLYYFDPPYLITVAPYNSFWSEKDEIDLLHILDNLNDKGQKFMLSNVIESNGKENKILKEWMKKYNVHYIKRQYLNSSYHKKNLSNAIEIVITNF
ncbi:MAG: Dam family site-specific DNA-(adenine-N6)-methyltransferase [Clostridia bacterium]|nr:Dam family site-specific DNA-(adenine-N6)-methyltransferase [Clostridia bacterium]